MDNRVGIDCWDSGWAGQGKAREENWDNFDFKKTFLVFTNNFIDLDILSRSAISCHWLLVDRGQGCC